MAENRSGPTARDNTTHALRGGRTLLKAPSSRIGVVALIHFFILLGILFFLLPSKTRRVRLVGLSVVSVGVNVAVVFYFQSRGCCREKAAMCHVMTIGSKLFDYLFRNSIFVNGFCAKCIVDTGSIDGLLKSEAWGGRSLFAMVCKINCFPKG